MSPIAQLIEQLPLSGNQIDTDAFSLSLQNQETQSTNANDAILARCFSYAFKLHYNKPITKEDQQNLHLSPYSTAQCVALFLEHFPILSIVKRSLMDSILNQYGTAEEITLFDTGLKTGGLITAIITALHTKNPNLKKVSVIGCEPSKQLSALGHESITQLCDKRNIALSLSCINKSVDQLDTEEWSQIRENIAGPLIITALLSLHHSNNDTTVRNTLCRFLQALKPASLYIAEPDVDHVTIPYSQRIKNCYTHFKAIFDYIDTLQHLTESVRLSIKEIFVFEIIDIVGNRTEYIREGHNAASQWVDRLTEAGFSIHECPITAAASETANLQWSPLSKGSHNYTSIAYSTTPLLALMHCTIPSRRS